MIRKVDKKALGGSRLMRIRMTELGKEMDDEAGEAGEVGEEEKAGPLLTPNDSKPTVTALDPDSKH